jgi:hypothetical protein
MGAAMNEPREPASPPTPSVSPDRMRTGGGWFGLLFREHPVALAMWKVIAFVFIVYPPPIVLASFAGVSWIKAFSHAVDVLRRFIPIFDRLEQHLVVTGMGDEVAAVHHVFAIGYLFGIPIFLFMFVTVVRLSRDEMKRVATSTSPARLQFMFVASVLFLVFAVWWVAWGAAPYRHGLAMIEAGVMFAGIITIGLVAAVSFRAMTVMGQDEAKSR